MNAFANEQNASTLKFDIGLAEQPDQRKRVLIIHQSSSFDKAATELKSALTSSGFDTHSFERPTVAQLREYRDWVTHVIFFLDPLPAYEEMMLLTLEHGGSSLKFCFVSGTQETFGRQSKRIGSGNVALLVVRSSNAEVRTTNSTPRILRISADPTATDKMIDLFLRS